MIAGDLAKALLAILSVLVVIIVSRKFLGILARAIEGEVSGEILLTLLMLKILTGIALLLPPALFLSVLVVLGRLYRDNEMAVLASSGAGPARLYRSVLLFVVPLAVFGGVMALQVMPWSEKKAQLLMKKDEQGADVRGIKPGRFNEFSRGDVILYAAQLSDDGVMHEVFVQSRQGERTGVVIAEDARLKLTETGEHFISLGYGRRYQGVPGQADFVISEFEEYAVRIDDPAPSSGETGREGMDSLALFHSNNPRGLAELQKRLAIPFGILALGVLAVPLARVAPRAGAWGNVFKAFMIYVVYENVQKISQGMLVTGKVSLPIAYGGAYVVIALLTAFLLVRAFGWRWALAPILPKRK
ncbi:MAG: LPS export ABC transporter permease LptF [Methylotetracoccus sp.]